MTVKYRNMKLIILNTIVFGGLRVGIKPQGWYNKATFYLMIKFYILASVQGSLAKHLVNNNVEWSVRISISLIIEAGW